MATWQSLILHPVSTCTLQCFKLDLIFYKTIIEVLALLTELLYTGSFHQYDGIMYPEVPVKSALKTLTNFFGYSSDQAKPVHDVVQQKCLPVYLSPFKEKLLECSVNDLSKSVADIMDIYFQMVSTKIYTDKVCNYGAPSVKKVCITKVPRSTATLICLHIILSDYGRLAVDSCARTKTASM